MDFNSRSDVRNRLRKEGRVLDTDYGQIIFHGSKSNTKNVKIFSGAEEQFPTSGLFIRDKHYRITGIFRISWLGEDASRYDSPDLEDVQSATSEDAGAKRFRPEFHRLNTGLAPTEADERDLGNEIKRVAMRDVKKNLEEYKKICLTAMYYKRKHMSAKKLDRIKRKKERLESLKGEYRTQHEDAVDAKNALSLYR